MKIMYLWRTSREVANGYHAHGRDGHMIARGGAGRINTVSLRSYYGRGDKSIDRPKGCQSGEAGGARAAARKQPFFTRCSTTGSILPP